MNSAGTNSTTNAERNISTVSSSLSPSNYIPESISSDHIIGSSTSPPVLQSSHSQINNTASLNTIIPPVIRHPYMNMAAVAAAFLQGGFNSHMNNSPQSSCTTMHPPSPGHPFFPPPPPAHGFIPEFSNIVSTSTPKAFVTPLSVPLQSHRIPHSSPVLADKSMLEDSGISGMMSPPLSTPTSEGSTVNSSTGSSSGGSGVLKRKCSNSGSLQNVPSTTTSGINNSTTPTSTMTRTHQYKKVNIY